MPAIRDLARLRAFALAAVAALALAACAPQPFTVYEQPVARVGTVESVQQVVANPDTSGLGMIAGALVGGGLGSLVGGGTGRTVATVVGAVGGGFAGNQIERNNPQMTWQISVRYDDGSFATIRQAATPIVRPGDRVRVTGTGLELIGR
jgi:outer membrane lipoprotein SlyB